MVRKLLYLPISLVVTVAGRGVNYCARRLVDRRNTPGKLLAWMVGSPERLLADGRIDAHRTVRIADGTKIDVWILRRRASSPPPRGTVVVLHGLMSSKARALPLAERLAQAGYDVVLPDLRAHGNSSGRYVTFGAREKHEVKAVMDELLAERLVSDRVYAFGISMGAATAVQYAALDSRCCGVLAVAPYTDLRSIARKHAPWISDDTFDAVLERAGDLGEFDPDDASTIAAAARLTVPLIVVHGWLDTIVPYRHGRAVFDAARGPKRMIPIPAAGHFSILLARDAWFVRKIVELEEMRPSARPAV